MDERIRGFWTGTAYLAGLRTGTSRHNIPSASLSLHVLGRPNVGEGGFYMFVRLFHVDLNDVCPGRIVCYIGRTMFSLDGVKGAQTSQRRFNCVEGPPL